MKEDKLKEISKAHEKLHNAATSRESHLMFTDVQGPRYR